MNHTACWHPRLFCLQVKHFSFSFPWITSRGYYERSFSARYIDASTAPQYAASKLSEMHSGKLGNPARVRLFR